MRAGAWRGNDHSLVTGSPEVGHGNFVVIELTRLLLDVRAIDAFPNFRQSILDQLPTGFRQQF